MMKLFLSASVPLPDRDPRFTKTADVVAIREAVKALVTVIAPQGKIVFGGHPAITPLVALILKDMNAVEKSNVVVYQSRSFAKKYPSEIMTFVTVRYTKRLSRENADRDSIFFMRQKMISGTKFDAAVFIGGMEGIFEEHDLFAQYHPNAKIWPIASTGAAAAELFEKVGSPHPELFRDELTYQTLFRKLAQQLPN